MTELHSNGQHEAYLAQLLNPQFGGAQVNPGLFNAIGGAGFGGLAGNAVPNVGNPLQNPLQNPWAMQNVPQMNAVWSQQPGQQTQQSPGQPLAAIQLAQQIAARQAAQAIQNAQTLQALQQQMVQQQMLQQISQNPIAQQWGQPQWGQPGFGPQTPFGNNANASIFGGGQFGQGYGQFNATGAQNLINQVLQQQAQQQALQQLVNYLAATQGGQFR